MVGLPFCDGSVSFLTSRGVCVFIKACMTLRGCVLVLVDSKVEDVFGLRGC